ncbi:unnamed protein product, partial [Closterium sp. Naga37s-1]
DIETWAVSPRGAGWLFGARVTTEVPSSSRISSPRISSSRISSPRISSPRISSSHISSPRISSSRISSPRISSPRISSSLASPALQHVFSHLSPSVVAAIIVFPSLVVLPSLPSYRFCLYYPPWLCCAATVQSDQRVGAGV